MKFPRYAVLQKRATDVYHKKILINIREAIIHHLQGVYKNTDIVRDHEFNTANRALDGPEPPSLQIIKKS